METVRANLPDKLLRFMNFLECLRNFEYALSCSLDILNQCNHILKLFLLMISKHSHQIFKDTVQKITTLLLFYNDKIHINSSPSLSPPSQNP